jgi:hypothetical protein
MNARERVNVITNRWVRKLTGQARGLYTPGLRVRGSPHPYSSRFGVLDKRIAYPVRFGARMFRCCCFDLALLFRRKTCSDQYITTFCVRH